MAPQMVHLNADKMEEQSRDRWDGRTDVQDEELTWSPKNKQFVMQLAAGVLHAAVDEWRHNEQ
jgi:hypothetical protein